MAKDKEAINDYKRQGLYGVKKAYIHEKAHKISILQAAVRTVQSGKRFVQRSGDIPKGCSRVVKISRAQHKAYGIIVETSKTYPEIPYSALRKIGIRDKTLKALSKEKLIEIKDDVVTLWRNKPTDQGVRKARSHPPQGL